MSNIKPDSTESLMLDSIRATLNDAMKEAAEPVIKEALVKIESEMRERLSACLIRMLEGKVDLLRNQHQLHIIINDDYLVRFANRE